MKAPIFDVSGIHGAPSTSGKNFGHSTAHTSQHGLWGGHGANGQHGTSAGTISLRLTTPPTTANIPQNVVLANPIDADVKLDGSIVCTAGRLQNMHTVLKIRSGELMAFLAAGGNGAHGGNGGDGENGGKGFMYGAFLVLSFNESIYKYALRTADRMQLDTVTVPMAVLVATEEMAVMQVQAVMLDLVEPFEFLFPKSTLISLRSVTAVPSIFLPEEGVQKENQGSEASFFRIILPRPLSEINLSIRRRRKGWRRRLAILEYKSRWFPWPKWCTWHRR